MKRRALYNHATSAVFGENPFETSATVASDVRTAFDRKKRSNAFTKAKNTRSIRPFVYSADYDDYRFYIGVYYSAGARETERKFGRIENT